MPRHASPFPMASKIGLVPWTGPFLRTPPPQIVVSVGNELYLTNGGISGLPMVKTERQINPECGFVTWWPDILWIMVTNVNRRVCSFVLVVVFPSEIDYSTCVLSNGKGFGSEEGSWSWPWPWHEYWYNDIQYATLVWYPLFLHVIDSHYYFRWLFFVTLDRNPILHELIRVCWETNTVLVWMDCPKSNYWQWHGWYSTNVTPGCHDWMALPTTVPRNPLSCHAMPSHLPSTHVPLLL